MAILTGFGELVEKLSGLARAQGDPEPAVVVGYTQSYAIYVHENLTAHHDVGQAKFLQQPFYGAVNGMAERVAAKVTL